MQSRHLLLVAALAAAAAAGRLMQEAPPSTDQPIPVGPDGKYTLVADGIRAQFIPYGASITNLFINDTNGVERDIVLGFDNATAYENDKAHAHMGGVPGKWPIRGEKADFVGRYANRIRNS
jgi:aldose 1-epimerase